MPPRDHFTGTPEQIMAMFAETGNTSDRVAAVSCAAFLDDSLGAALAARFVRLDKKWEDQIFSGPTAPLGIFSAKTRIGYALGLYGPLTRQDLETVGSIRNRFAHTAGPISFADTRIAEKCHRLTTPIRLSQEGWGLGAPFPPDIPRSLYIHTAQHIAARLIGQIRASPPPRPSFPDALP